MLNLLSASFAFLKAFAISVQKCGRQGNTFHNNVIGRCGIVPQSDEYELVTIEKKLAEGETTVFQFRDCAGMTSEGLVIRYEGKLHAFRNVCRHQPLSLDYGDGDFLTDDGRYLLCRNHGALFEPDSGFCVSGPCSGATLTKYEVEEQDGKITIRIPIEIIDLE